MKYTPLTKTNLFAELDELDAWLVGRGITQGNRLRIYRENFIAMKEQEKTVGAADVFAKI